jgi:hypothetical protein
MKATGQKALHNDSCDEIRRGKLPIVKPALTQHQ